jgi:predicted acylesterase/phospholipase RssA
MATVIESINSKPNGTLGVVIKQPDIKSLVFEGGGPKGLGYIGAIERLELSKILQTVENVGGSSAGAMTALAVGLGYNAKQIGEIIAKVDIKSFQDLSDTPSSSRIISVFQGFGNLAGSDSQGRGLFVGNKLRQWAKTVILERFKEAKYERFVKDISQKEITFRVLEKCRTTFPELGIKRIAFTGTNYTDARLEVFDFHRTPDMPVDLAVRISMSLPWFFQSVKYNGKEYMDGGCLNNYPMFIFNAPPYYTSGVTRILKGEQGVFSQNLCTLGLKVDNLKEIQTILWETAKKKPESLLAQFWIKLKKQTVHSFVGVDVVDADKQLDLETYNSYPQRTIQIPDLGYSTTNFALTDADKDKLAKSGYEATEKWLQNYFIDGGVEIEIDSRQIWDAFCSLNSIDNKGEVEKRYAKKLAALK